jgi:4-amino-4-deoxy-L-arabinose transferase-like glycosyltransferase
MIEIVLATPKDRAWNSIRAYWSRLPGIRTVLIVAAFLRLASIPLVHNFHHPDTWEFGPIAKNIDAGLGYTVLLKNGLRVPSAWEPPAYAYFLAFFYRLGGESPMTYLIIEILQAALGILLVYVVYRLALLLLGQRCAIVAAGLIAIYPAQVYMCNEIHSISIYILLEVAAVFFLIRYLKVTQSWKDIIAAGLCMGLTMLFRGEAPAILLLYAVILVLLGGRRAARYAAVFVLIASACLAPWTIRNYREFGRIVPVATIGGWDLWIGNNPQATGSDRYNFAPPPPEVQKAFDQVPLDREYEVAKDDAIKKITLNYMRTHPRQEAVLVMKKLFMFFVFDPGHQKGRRPAYWVPSLLLTFLAVYGAILRGKDLIREDLFLVASVLLAVAVGVAVIVLPRYKIAIDPFLVIFAANAIVHLASWTRQGATEGSGQIRDTASEPVRVN